MTEKSNMTQSQDPNQTVLESLNENQMESQMERQERLTDVSLDSKFDPTLEQTNGLQ